ncbi:hypothetical protein CDAR_187791 [Caerostris darwini]|uniref:Uncharacterized protein n=1 Tax=Caerostris darwini TaxID=1538125 RepID=A0AAV4N918_9ARAC|nr:hypothetical protein CDAR_187791 [Caerostris darwini]
MPKTTDHLAIWTVAQGTPLGETREESAVLGIYNQSYLNYVPLLPTFRPKSRNIRLFIRIFIYHCLFLKIQTNEKLFY